MNPDFAGRIAQNCLDKSQLVAYFGSCTHRCKVAAADSAASISDSCNQFRVGGHLFLCVITVIRKQQPVSEKVTLQYTS